MAPKLKEIERLNKAPKPRNVKEKIDLLREKSDHYHFGKREKAFFGGVMSNIVCT